MQSNLFNSISIQSRKHLPLCFTRLLSIFFITIAILFISMTTPVFASGTLTTDVQAASDIHFLLTSNTSESTIFFDLNIGESHNFDCENCEDAAFISSNTNVASFDNSCHILTTHASGFTNILTVCPAHGRQYYRIQVSNPTLTLNKNHIKIYYGSNVCNTYQLQAAKHSGAGKIIKWTSADKSIASVNSSGLVRSRGEGTTTITATLNNITSMCTVEVIRTDIILPTDTISLSLTGKGASCKITPTIIGPNKKIKWKSSNKKCVSVSNGTIKAKAPGTATVTVAANGISKTILVTVKPSVSIDKKAVTLYKTAPYDSITLKAYMGKKIAQGVWSSSDEKIVTVNNGSLTPLNEGTAIIEFTSDNSLDTCVATVLPVSIALNQTNISIASKGPLSSQVLQAIVSGPPKSKIKWTTSDKTIASVSAKGIVTGKKAGSALICATANGVSAYCTVDVIPTSITEVPAISIINGVGQSTTIHPVITGASDVPVYTSTNTNIATVSSNGIITARAPGTCNITVTANGLKSTCKVKVLEKDMYFVKEIIGLNTSNHKSETIKPIIRGIRGPVTWYSSNESVASVSPNGVVTAVHPGSAIISATLENITNTCTVIVTDTTNQSKPAYIDISPHKKSLNVRGENTSCMLEMNLTYTNEPVIWSSTNPKVASVTSDGIVRAVSPGKATIKASVGNKHSQCKIRVIDNKIKLNKYLINLNYKSKKTHTFKLKPSITGISKNVQYISSNENVVIVKNGLLQAIDEGSAYIIVSANGIETICDVNVKNPSHIHSFDEKTIRNPTCVKSGLKSFVCKSCYDDFEETISSLGHDYSDESIIDSQPTCTESGTQHKPCLRPDCNEYFSEPIPPIGHSFPKEFITDILPTCIQPGTKHKQCLRPNCNEYISESISPLGHNFSSEFILDSTPTCVDAGVKSRHCMNNNCSIVTDEVPIQALGHEYIEHRKDNNYIEDGYMYESCERCSNTINEKYYIKISGNHVTLPESTFHNKGSILTLTATVDDDYKFDGWYIDNQFTSKQDSYTLSNISSAHSVIAKTSLKYIQGTGSVTLCNWSYGDDPCIPVAESETNDIENVFFRYKRVDEPDDSYTTAVPSEPGSYMIQATFPAFNNYLECTATNTFSITTRPISDVSVSPIDTQSYTGSPVLPAPKLSINKLILIEGKDYTLEYKNNTDEGCGLVIIKGMNYFTGYMECPFTISTTQTSLLPGPTINSVFREISESNSDINNPAENIRLIEFVRTSSSDLPAGEPIDINGRTSAVYSSDTNTVTVYCDATTIYADSNFSSVFKNMQHVVTINGFYLIDTSSATTMNDTFNKTGYLVQDTFFLDLSSIDTSNVTKMLRMFEYTGFYAKKCEICIPTISNNHSRNTAFTILGNESANRYFDVPSANSPFNHELNHSIFFTLVDNK